MYVFERTRVLSSDLVDRSGTFAHYYDEHSMFRAGQ